MRSRLSSVAILASALQLVSAQTFTDCNPTEKVCPADPGWGKKVETDFTQGKSADWTLADGTSMTYDGTKGAVFSISKKTDAPTVSSAKYIMFGKVRVEMMASTGTGIVSSFILESDDLDEIDWEWLGGTDSSVESNFFGKGNTTAYDRAIYHPMTQATEQYHNYTIDWTKDAVVWSIGDTVVRTLAYNDPKTVGGKNYPQTPMKVKMGSWIGCVDAAAAADPKTKGTCDWAGGPVDFSKAAFNMYVKSVTIEDYGCGGDYTYSDLTGSYQSIKSSGTCDGKGTSGSSSSSSASSASSATSSATGSSSGSATTSASASASATSNSAGILAQTSVSNTTATTSSSDSTGTTLSTTATSPGASTSGTTTATGAAATKTTVTASGATGIKPKHSYGFIDFAVIGLGLGLGYLVM